MKNWMKWTVMTLALAAVFHLLFVVFLPNAIMALFSSKALKDLKASVNTAIYLPRITADKKTVVMPCPDLLYTLCIYDVTRNPLRIKVPAPRDTYFSISMFASNTDNYYILNDRQLVKDNREILLIRKGTSYPGSEHFRVVEAITPTGVILCRTLITDEEKIKDMVEIQHQVVITEAP